MVHGVVRSADERRMTRDVKNNIVTNEKFHVSRKSHVNVAKLS